MLRDLYMNNETSSRKLKLEGLNGLDNWCKKKTKSMMKMAHQGGKRRLE